MTWSHADFAGLAELINHWTGLCFPPERCAGAEQGIGRAMARAGFTRLDYYRERLETDPSLMDDLVAELTVGETYFFREPGQFAFIRREVLPDLLNRRGQDHVIRVWSAGCASGEEAYSLAILFDQAGLGARTHVLGTDISRTALAQAQQASYSPWSLRGPEAAAAEPYLIRRDRQLVLAGDIRRRVAFEYLNLARSAYPSFATGTWGMDLILCRNVLIYLDEDTVHKVAGRLFQCLAQGGWLITASSDPPLQGLVPFETVVTEEGAFYRRAEEKSDGWPVTRDECRVRSDESKGMMEQEVVSPYPILDSEIQKDQDRTLPKDRQQEVDAVRSLAREDVAKAERACAEALERYPLDAELHFLHAVLLLDLGRQEEATRALRRTLYLDRTLAVAHFTLGSLLMRQGDLAGARRAYRNAHDLALARTADEVLPLADGERAGELAEAADFQIALLDATKVFP